MSGQHCWQRRGRRPRGDPAGPDLLGSLVSEERPWTVAEAAEYLQHTPETIRRWARKGKLPGVKDLADEWRFSPTAIRQLLHLVAPAPAVAQDAEVLRAQLDLAYARSRARWRS